MDLINNEDIRSLKKIIENLVENYKEETEMNGPLDGCLVKQRIRRELLNYISRHTGTRLNSQHPRFQNFV